MIKKTDLIQKLRKRAGFVIAASLVSSLILGSFAAYASDSDDPLIGTIPLPSYAGTSGTDSGDSEQFLFSTGSDVIPGTVKGEGTPDDSTGTDPKPVDGTDIDQGPVDGTETSPSDEKELLLYKNTEQGFCFLYPEDAYPKTSQYGSALIDLYKDIYMPFILVACYDWTNDGKAYLETIKKNAIEGNEIMNEPIGPDPVENNPGMYALNYSILSAGEEIQITCFTEEFDDSFIYFETRYYNDSDPVRISEVLSTVLSTAKPDPDYYG